MSEYLYQIDTCFLDAWENNGYCNLVSAIWKDGYFWLWILQRYWTNLCFCYFFATCLKKTYPRKIGPQTPGCLETRVNYKSQFSFLMTNMFNIFQYNFLSTVIFNFDYFFFFIYCHFTVTYMLHWVSATKETLSWSQKRSKNTFLWPTNESFVALTQCD